MIFGARPVGKSKNIVGVIFTCTKHKEFSNPNQLINFVKTNLAEYKYPRWIEFLDKLPKTATGKIQRFKLRTAS